MPRLNARFFGYPAIELDGLPVKIERRKTLALLAYLLVNGESITHGRESLAALFWPEMGQAEALASLRHSLWEINHELGEGWLDKDGQAIRLHLEQEARIDTLEFEALLEKSRQKTQADPYSQILLLLEAVALYRGDFLAGFTLRDCHEFDRWQSEVGERLRERFAVLLSKLAEAYGQAGEHDAAIACARRRLALDPLNEAAHRALMLRYDQADQRLSALRQYDECARVLKKELGVIPEPATRAVYEQILSQKKAPEIIPSAPMPALAENRTPIQGEAQPALPSIQVTLPSAATPFVGRQAELANIVDLLAKPECRLLSLVGPGGIGKTRLAIQAVQRLHEGHSGVKGPPFSRPAFPDGVFFISLAEASSIAVMLKMIAQTIGCPFREELATPAGMADNRLRLMHFLSAKKCLLALDNLEHLAESSGMLGDILKAAPYLKILATSRHRLKLPQEWLVELNGMPVPGYREKGDFQEYSSVQLFLENAQRSSSAFNPDAQDMAAIGRICQLVDGMPLGIELAAAWVRTFSCAEIAEEIERNLDFLYSSTQGVTERHQSLRAAFEYSWRLLPETERSVIRRLSVFRGGFSRELAARIAGATLPVLTALMDRCLLHRLPTGRYELHEVLKQYVREKLAAEVLEEQEALDFHSETYLDFLIEVGEQLKKTGLENALRALEAEFENVHLAWDRAVEFRRVDHLLRAVPALILYYETANHWARGRETFTRVLTIFEADEKQWLARLQEVPDAYVAVDPAEENELAFLALLKAAWKRFNQFNLVPREAAEHTSRDLMKLVRPLPDRREKALCLIMLNIGYNGLNREEVQNTLRQAIRILEQEQDGWGQAIAWLIFADSMNLTFMDNQAGRTAYSTSLEKFLAIGNEWGKAVCYNGLGNIALREGQLGEARGLWSESVAVFHKLNSVWREIDARSHLAEACEKDGALQEALSHIQENIRLLIELGDRWNLAWQYSHSARLERRCGRPEVAEQHQRQALDLFHQLGDLESARKIGVQ